MSDFDYENYLLPGEVNPRTKGPDGLRLKFCLEQLKGKKGRLIEIGCNTGRYLKPISRLMPDIECYGVDLSEKAIKEAKKSESSVKFSVGDCRDLSFKNDFFDFILVFDVLEHIDKPKKMLREIVRVAKNNAILVMFVPCDINTWSFHWFFGRKLKLIPIQRLKRDYVGHIQMFKIKDIYRLLAQHNIEIEDKYFSFHYLGQLLDILDYTVREDYLFKAKSKGLKYKFVNKFYHTTARILTKLMYYESRLLKSIGFGAGAVELAGKIVKE